MFKNPSFLFDIVCTVVWLLLAVRYARKGFLASSVQLGGNVFSLVGARVFSGWAAVEVFQRFLMRIKHIDPDMDAALVDLKAAIDNEVWREWCDAVMACQTDRSLTSILTPIVSKLSDMRVVNAELENLVFGPRKEFITMAILVLINIPLVRFINKDWYHTLVATIPGQMVIAVCLAAVFVSFAFVVKLTQPIEYRR